MKHMKVTIEGGGVTVTAEEIGPPVNSGELYNPRQSMLHLLRRTSIKFAMSHEIKPPSITGEYEQ